MKRSRITTATTTLVRTGPGTLHTIVVGKGVAAGVITVYDALTATGTPIAVITFGIALLSDPPITALYDIDFSVGLCVVTSQATDITLSYQTLNP